MIDIEDLKQNLDRYKTASVNKRTKIDFDSLLGLSEEVKKIRFSFETLRSQQNSFSKSIGSLKGEEKQAGLEKMKILAEEVKKFSSELSTKEEELRQILLRVPNPPLEGVPVGKDDTENVEVKKWGEVKEFTFRIKDHVELGKNLNLIDIERGVKIAGARNYFLRGDGMRLSHAVMNLALDLLHKKGYTLMDPPHIVGYGAMMGTGYFPGGEESAYQLDQRDKDAFLIGTSEVSVASYHQDEILEEDKLPLRYAGYSPCYRREAGTYGKDTQGLYRVHQFYKVEQVVICKADMEESHKFHNELLGNAEELLQLLHIPYRVVAVCTGDMGQGQVWKHDIESWMPSRKNYGETHSCSSFLDFQSRRLNLRYKDSKVGKNRFCYTLNNTLIASPRVLIPLLELNQREDGRIVIPEVLRKYMGEQDLI